MGSLRGSKRKPSDELYSISQPHHHHRTSKRERPIRQTETLNGDSQSASQAKSLLWNTVRTQPPLQETGDSLRAKVLCHNARDAENSPNRNPQTRRAESRKDDRPFPYKFVVIGPANNTPNSAIRSHQSKLPAPKKQCRCLYRLHQIPQLREEQTSSTSSNPCPPP